MKHKTRNMEPETHNIKHASSFMFQASCLARLCSLFWVTNAEAASLYISPGSGTYGVGSTFTVTVRTDTQGAAVNTTEANISYSSELELVSVSQSALFYLPAPGSPAKS